MRTATAAATCAALLTVAACGGAANGMNSANGTSGGTPATNGTNANTPTANGGSPSAASSTAITQYQDLTSQVQSAAVSYGATMAGPGMTLAKLLRDPGRLRRAGAPLDLADGALLKRYRELINGGEARGGRAGAGGHGVDVLELVFGGRSRSRWKTRSRVPSARALRWLPAARVQAAP